MLEKSGLANPNTARSLKAAAKILESEEERDVRKIDVGLAIRRYNNRNPGKLSPRSLKEYRRRIESLIREFQKYHEDPTSYSGIGGGNASGEVVKRKRRTPKNSEPPATPAERPHDSSPTPPRGGLSLDFPLRDDFLAQIVVPRDLRTTEARRLCAFVMTLAADFEPGDT